MFKNIILQLKYEFFCIEFALNKKLNGSITSHKFLLKITKFLKPIIWLFSYLISFVFIVGFYLLIYGSVVTIVVILLVQLFKGLDVQKLTAVISFIVGIFGIIIAIISATSQNKKSFSLEKINAYTCLIEFLLKQVEEIKNKKPIEDFTNLPNLMMYASNRVIMLMSQIKFESSKMKTDNDMKALLSKVAFTIDYMRYEIKIRSTYQFFITNYSYYYLEDLYNGAITEDIYEDNLEEVEENKTETNEEDINKAR